MALSLQNFSTTVQNMAAAAQGACRKLLNLTSGSALLAAFQAVAGNGLWLQAILLVVLQRTRLYTSTGLDADSWGADFSFTRLPATYSSGSVNFTRFVPATSALVPVGAQVRTADGTQAFTVIADSTNTYWNGSNGFIIPIGTATAPITVQAVNAGTQGNVIENTITLPVGSFSGIDTVNNPATFTNGLNAESDPSFKARFQNYIQTRAQATLAAIIYAVTSIAQNITCSVAEFQNTAGAYTPGMFVAYVDDGTGSPSSNTIATASSAVNAVRACGIQYAVQAANLITANVAFSFTVSAGTIKANILASVEAGVAAYINGLPEGAPLYWSRLYNIIYSANAGISEVTGLLVNGGTADIGGAANQVVRAGTVTAS